MHKIFRLHIHQFWLLGDVFSKKKIALHEEFLNPCYTEVVTVVVVVVMVVRSGDDAKKRNHNPTNVSIVGEVFPERISGSAALRDEVSHPVPEEVGFTRVRHVVPVRQLLFEHGVGQAAGQP